MSTMIWIVYVDCGWEGQFFVSAHASEEGAQLAISELIDPATHYYEETELQP